MIALELLAVCVLGMVVLVLLFMGAGRESVR